MNTRFKISVEEAGWWLLTKSGIFRYLFRRFLTTLCFELERFDLDREQTKEKYRAKLTEYAAIQMNTPTPQEFNIEAKTAETSLALWKLTKRYALFSAKVSAALHEVFEAGANPGFGEGLEHVNNITDGEVKEAVAAEHERLRPVLKQYEKAYPFGREFLAALASIKLALLPLERENTNHQEEAYQYSDHQ
jgi:hypothetical protein